MRADSRSKISEGSSGSPYFGELRRAHEGVDEDVQVLGVRDHLREFPELLDVGFGEGDLVEAEDDRIHADVAEDLAALPGRAAIVGVEDVTELADDPAARAGQRPAVDVVETDVLVDHLAAAHLVLIGERQPDELGMAER